MASGPEKISSLPMVEAADLGIVGAEESEKAMKTMILILLTAAGLSGQTATIEPMYLTDHMLNCRWWNAVQTPMRFGYLHGNIDAMMLLLDKYPQDLHDRSLTLFLAVGKVCTASKYESLPLFQAVQTAMARRWGNSPERKKKK